MIVQEHGGGLLLFRQTDHALLSGLFADAWGNERIPRPEHRDSVLVAAARHDDGWADWELAPKLLPTGAPVDFIRMPIVDHVTLYRRGIDLVEAEDLYAGLIASLHGERLYTRPFEPGMEPRIERLEGHDWELAQGYVSHERERQERLVAELSEHHDGRAKELGRQAEEAWRLLQVWDRLSLLVCMQPLQPGTQRTLPPIAAFEDDVAITAHASEDGELVCEPYPFSTDGVEFTLEAFRTQERTWPDEAAFRRAYRTAARVLVTFRCRPG